MRIFLMVLMVMHGLIHLMGFAKAFKLAELSEFKNPVSKPAGLLWLTATLLFLASFFLLLLNISQWWILGSAGILISQILIFNSWTDAKWGTLANIILLIGGVLTLVY